MAKVKDELKEGMAKINADIAQNTNNFDSKMDKMLAEFHETKALLMNDKHYTRGLMIGIVIALVGLIISMLLAALLK
jgi:ABC-type phosphate/phosphonate transport system permease subunit